MKKDKKTKNQPKVVSTFGLTEKGETALRGLEAFEREVNKSEKKD